MNLSEMINEHRRLVKVLKHGDKKELKKELKIQEKELKGYKMKKMDYCPHCHARKPHIKFGGWKMCKTCSYQERY